nr:MAG TPA: hypothetical protein [Caudoviricetes sp.]
MQKAIKIGRLTHNFPSHAQFLMISHHKYSQPPR